VRERGTSNKSRDHGVKFLCTFWDRPQKSRLF
jgi:hypothetical protein